MSQSSTHAPEGGASQQLELQTLIVEALPENIGLKPLDGFNMNLSGKSEFRKVFFSAHCDCGTAALLSVEISKDKTQEEISDALPSLIERLESQARSFYGMSCEIHGRMRVGPADPSPE